MKNLSQYEELDIIGGAAKRRTTDDRNSGILCDPSASRY